MKQSQGKSKCGIFRQTKGLPSPRRVETDAARTT